MCVCVCVCVWCVRGTSIDYSTGQRIWMLWCTVYLDCNILYQISIQIYSVMILKPIT